MNIRTSETNQHRIPFIALVPFLLITFGLTWGVFALFILFQEQMTAIFGEVTGQHPLFILAVWTPAIAAFISVTYHSGLGSLRRYLSRLLLWRCPLAWYAFLTVGIPLLFYSGSALKGNLFAEPFPFTSVQSLILALALTMITPCRHKHNFYHRISASYIYQYFSDFKI
ncbi:MAG: hypothetical protein HC851_16750 [Acaryochloris sp. RU_4_1]|nr:hypothetical protein [Acaryochloris sp. RU_4_1]